MDYLLITVLVFLSSFFGNILASTLNKGEKKSISSPIATITKKVNERKEKKAMQEELDNYKEWLYANEQVSEGEGK